MEHASNDWSESTFESIANSPQFRELNSDNEEIAVESRILSVDAWLDCLVYSCRQKLSCLSL